MKREDPIVNSAIQKALRAGVSRSKGFCPDDNRLGAYLENRLSQHESERMEEHLAGCSQCQEIVSLSITLAAPESEVVDEVSPHPGKTVLFRLSLPISALALIVLGVAAGVLFLRTPGLRKAEKATQMADAKLPGQMPQAAPETPSLRSSEDQQFRDKPAMPAASSEVRAVERKDKNTRVAKDLKAQIAEDEKIRVAEESVRKNAPAPAPPPQPVLKRAEIMNEKSLDREKEKMDSPSRSKLEQNPSIETSATGGLKGVGKETDRRLQGEGLQQKQQVAAPVATVQTYVSDGDRQKKLPLSPESVLLSFAQQPLDQLEKTRASGKVEYGNLNASNAAGNKLQSARQVGSKMFYLFSEYWIDSQCRDFPKVPVVEIGESEPGFQEILKALPEISALRSAHAPVLIHWQEKNYLLRFRSP